MNDKLGYRRRKRGQGDRTVKGRKNFSEPNILGTY